MVISKKNLTRGHFITEELYLDKAGISEIEKLVKGDLTREEFQSRLMEQYKTNEQH